MEKIRKPKLGRSKTYETRKQAFKQAKKDRGIPSSEWPSEVVKSGTRRGNELGLNEKNNRLYIFRAIFNFFNRLIRPEVRIRKDHEAYYEEGHKQIDHFNVGEIDADDGEKLRDHYYFKRKK